MNSMSSTMDWNANIRTQTLVPSQSLRLSISIEQTYVDAKAQNSQICSNETHLYTKHNSILVLSSYSFLLSMNI